MLRIIADDLTGALDTAAPFATPDSPVRLVLNGEGNAGDKLTLSTESRHLSEAAAMAQVVAAHVGLRVQRHKSPLLWFKKVDSVLRGHPLAETLALAQAGGFAHCIFAPAFPQMGRVTINGGQWVQTPSGEWRPTEEGDLRQAFAALVPRHAPGLDLVVLDAETDEGLRKAVQPWLGESGVLWAGSRGLAQALATPFAPLEPAPVGLIVIGTSHTATRAQAVQVRARTHSAPDEGEFAPVASHPLLVDPVPVCTTSAQTNASLSATLKRLRSPTDGSATVVTGGDTLTILLRSVNAHALDCLGEIGAGLPLSRIVGGRMAGTVLITKSGGFGGPELLRDLVWP